MSSAKKQKDKYLFNVDDYKVVRCINRGGFGVINLVRNKKSGEEYAAKTNLIQTQAQNKLFVSREVRILIQIQHSTFIQFRGFSYKDFDGNKNITILMDYMKEGSLADLIGKEMKSLCPIEYDNTKRQIILVGIARGMMLLHKFHIIHRDLKSENILLDIFFHPHITDFGLSKFFDPHHSMNQSITNAGTAAYMAPEVINSDHFNTKADVFAFGILMYEVITGKRAYQDLLKGKNKLNDFQLKVKVTQGLRPEIEEKTMKKHLKKLIEKCWSANPKERPSFTEIFRKLSLSRDDYFLQFEEDFEEPTIIDDDDDEENEIDDELLINTKYCLDGVDIDEFLDYVDEIKEESKSFNIEKSQWTNSEDVEQMKKEIDALKSKISKFETDLESEKKEFKSKISKLETDLESEKSENKKFKSKISELEKEVERFKKLPTSSIQKFPGNFFYSELSLTEPGILHHLKEQQKSPFDRLFIVSTSSNDICNLINPNTTDTFSTTDTEFFFIEFEFEKSVEINGMIIFSASWQFPKSFDIEIEGRTIKSIKNANELNGKNKKMEINFGSISCKKIRLIQTGPCWDKKNNLLSIKRIELIQSNPIPPDTKYLFSSLLQKSEGQDPHRCPVLIRASLFDFNRIHDINAKKANISTFPRENSWLMIELTRGFAIISGFRLKRRLPAKLRSFKIICSEDASMPEDAWTEIFVLSEKTENEHQMLDVYEFLHPSPPTRFIKIIQTGPTWDNRHNLHMLHFDIFGYYF